MRLTFLTTLLLTACPGQSWSNMSILGGTKHRSFNNSPMTSVCTGDQKKKSTVAERENYRIGDEVALSSRDSLAGKLYKLPLSYTLPALTFLEASPQGWRGEFLLFIYYFILHETSMNVYNNHKGNNNSNHYGSCLSEPYMDSPQPVLISQRLPSIN